MHSTYYFHILMLLMNNNCLIQLSKLGNISNEEDEILCARGINLN